ncbi:class I SAM-dependent methyltransferase [Butyrivibrio fibrisolvens]|nr:class I SAM-dependent methyltransferase [Butyrivibrio fibrisolvens]
MLSLYGMLGKPMIYIIFIICNIRRKVVCRLEMNNIWSEYVQGIMTLYLSRKLRFDDIFFEQYKSVFQLDPEAKIKILEIGCGPGALAEALHRWYPKAEITAIDRDSSFISFAQNNIAGVTFLEGDATRLPFADNTFDVTISNTVQEHVEPTAFWGEQKRVLKSGGVCLCLSARKGLHCQAPCLEMTKEEKEFWESIPQSESELDKYGVCRYPMTEAELPASMEENGFYDVTTGYAVINLTPDARKYSARMAELMIEAKRQNDLEAIKSVHHEYDEKVINAVNAKYDERLRLYHEGIKQWDTSISLTMIVRGIK